ncbi:hypothetical protein MMC29_006836, partial [Sticta canariensis]|nr:hypothetical protein [Sticta canariensis]
MDDSLQRTPTTQHEDSDPLLKSTKIAPAETNDSEASLKLKSKIRYNPITPAGRQQIKRLILRSGAHVPGHAYQKKTKSPGRYSGWRMGSLISCILTGLCLLLTLTSLLVAVISGSPSGGVGTIFTGSCDTVERMDLWLHVAINVLGTIVIGASNFNMQCLNAPNRKEVDAAHAKGYWLDIGALSIRNFFYMSREKAWLWILLAFSTIPLHLLLNSAVFSTLQTNNYLVTVVTRDFRDFFEDEFNSCKYWYGPYPDVICSMYAAAHHKDNTSTGLTKLEPHDCIEKYASFVQNQFSKCHCSMPIQIMILQIRGDRMFTKPWNPMRWVCDDSLFDTCDLATALENIEDPNEKITHWFIHDNHKIDYCLASTVTVTCKLKISLTVVAFVVISNTIKLVAIIRTLSTLKDDRFITVGDAMASFLENPDHTTKGGCLAMKVDLERSFFRARRYFLGDNTCKNEPYEFLLLVCLRVETDLKSVPNVEVSLRWYQAPSNKRWFICMLA